MDSYQQDEKDISKVFTSLRTHLQAKEKELLELKRADPCLLAPDSDQINMLLNAINSLQLSTQDGSFIFESICVSDDIAPLTSVSSTGFNTIKTLPSTVWLSQSNPMKAENQRRSSSNFDHLLSLPINAYLASSWGITTKTQNQTFNRIPMVNHLLFMPIDAFKPPPTSIKTKNNKNLYVLFEGECLSARKFEIST